MKVFAWFVGAGVLNGLALWAREQLIDEEHVAALKKAKRDKKRERKKMRKQWRQYKKQVRKQAEQAAQAAQPS